MNFIANWIWRDEPESPSGIRVELITPKLLLGNCAAVPGLPKFE